MNIVCKHADEFSVFDRLSCHPFQVTTIFVFLFFVGCAAPSYNTIPTSPNIPPNARVLLMPLDVQLFELTAGGLEEPKADWTEAAEKNVFNALEVILEQKKDTILLYELPKGDPEKKRLHEQMMKLHETVGNSITFHNYFAGFKLPAKKDKFDWSLGRGIQRINERYDAHCALFIFIRDSYASAGRQVAIVLGAIAGIGVTGGAQRGFASLVDLQTGDILWFGRIFRPTGDLRTPKPANEAVSQLLVGIPL